MKASKLLQGVAAALFIFTATQVGAYGTRNSAAPTQKPAAIAHTVMVEETMNSGGYTYARVKKDSKSFWIAAPQTELEKGDTISFYEQMMMEGFTSTTLNRTFDRILFVSALSRGDSMPKVAAPVPNTKAPMMDDPAAVSYTHLRAHETS